MALFKDVMDEETFAPRLGGSFQDKICAGMLFNNKFGNVQNGDGNDARDQKNDLPRDSQILPLDHSCYQQRRWPRIMDIEVCQRIERTKWTFIRSPFMSIRLDTFKKVFPHLESFGCPGSTRT